MRRDRRGDEQDRARNGFDLRGNWGRGMLFYCLLQGNYLYKFLQDHETEGTKREHVDNTIRDMAKERKGPC
jgi:hypothetical protein